MSFDAKSVVVERFFHAALVAFRGDEMPYLLAPGFRCHAWARRGLPDGPSGACKLIAMLAAAFSQNESRIDEIFRAGDRVVVRYTFDAVHTGRLFGIPPSGNRVTATGIFIARLEGTRIAEIWREHDTLAVLEQMGGLPAAA